MKKITAILLCFLLLFFVPTAAYASSVGSVVVSGGSIGSGGLSGGYSQKSESTAITLTMALMYSLGITVKLSQDAINAGQSAYSYVQNKFYEWVGGSSAEQMTESQYEDLKSRFSVINGGSNVDPDGKIYLNGTALDMIRRFLNWLTGNDYIHNSSGGSSQDTVEINGVTTLYTDSSPIFYHDINTANRNIQFNFNKKVVFVQTLYSGRYYLSFYCNEPFTGVATKYNKDPLNISTDNIVSESNPINGYYYKEYIFIANTEWVGVGFIPKRINQWLADLDGSFIPDTSGSQENEGFNYEGDFDPDTLSNPDGNQTVVEPPLIDSMKNQNPDADASIGVDKYLEALKQILNQITNPLAVPESVPAQDLPTLAPVDIPVPDNLPVAWPVELPSSPTATPDLPQDNTPVVDPTQPADPDVSVPEMTVHLEDYFPFCLPFDVYHIMQKFNGSPQAPEVHLSFDAPTLNLHIPLDLDFSVFDSVASVLRNGESILYVVGLCVVTRKTFLRG